MSSQSRHSFHARVFPYVDLVLTVAVSGHEFIHVLGEHQVAYLTASLNGLERLELEGIPELDRSVLSSSARGEQALLMRRPGDCLDCGLMLTKLLEWLRLAPGTPYE